MTHITLDPEIWASHNAIQQQIADIQDTLQNMLVVIHRNSWPPPLTELPMQDLPISKSPKTSKSNSIKTLHPILRFDLLITSKSLPKPIGTSAFQPKHPPFKDQDYHLLFPLPTWAHQHWLSHIYKTKIH